MENNTQLPVEVVEQIEKEAEAHNNRLNEHAESEKDVAYAQGFAEGWHEGATAYATKLHLVQRENEKLKAMADGWRPMLEGALRENNHTAMYPDHFIEKIKKFLYGE